MPPVRWVTGKMTPAQVRAAERRDAREKAAAKESRDATNASLRAAAVKRRRAVLGSVKASDEPAPYEMKAWETVCKWDEAQEKAKRPRFSRPTVCNAMLATSNPFARRDGRPLYTPRAGTRAATFHTIVTSVEKQVGKPVGTQKGGVAGAAETTEKFARTKMKEAMALFLLPDAEFETKVFALDAAALIISACIKDDSPKGKLLRKLFAESKECESQIHRMLDELGDGDLQRLRDEEHQHLPALFVGNLLDTLKAVRKAKIWPEFGAKTVKDFIDETGGWSAEDGDEPKY